MMETLQIEIINPKARKLLNALAELNLIEIKDMSTPESLKVLLNKLRSDSASTPTPEEIQDEVKKVRKGRHGR